MLLVACAGTENTPPIAIHWSADGSGDQRTEHFVITNNTGKELADGWEVWFNQSRGRVIPPLPDEMPVQIEAISGGSGLVRMVPTENFAPLAPGETRDIVLPTNVRFNSNWNAPEGMFIVLNGKARPVAFSFDSIPVPARPHDGFKPQPITQTDIIPSPKSVMAAEGTTQIGKSVKINAPVEFAGDAALLAEKLKACGIEQGEGTAINFVADTNQKNSEGYTLKIENGEVNILAATGSGALYGAQTLLDMLKGATIPVELNNVTIQDWPDFHFRGQHVDIARNYTEYENVLKLIDLFASYKLNVFHFHFSDDEGWRLEIPGLPELTEVGARRGYTPDESDMLVPGYGGGMGPENTTGTGHLTRAEFIELLKYASARHILVIPEIESPGHARAAIVSMKARYNKYKDSDPAKATEYMLHDVDDKSVYMSIQDYNDNVMNVAMPSTYRFMEKVIDEIVAMYKEAGAPIWAVHVGGDEIPRGAWTASPIADKFMAENGIAGDVALGEYYILKVNELLAARGIKMAGWQELVEGRSDDFREKVKGNLGYVNCWSTNGASAEVPYTLANEGYPVVFSNVGNLYFDLAYSPSPEEPGLAWGGYVTDKASFAMQPYNIYASLRTEFNGTPKSVVGAGKGLVQLTPEGAKNILGLQGQLWAETFRNFDMVSRSLFPKMLGLPERAWNAYPDWSSEPNEEAAFEADYTQFRSIIEQKELPWLKGQGMKVREY